MVAEEDTWEFNGTIFRKCPKCDKPMPAAWLEHKCGWKSAYAKPAKDEDAKAFAPAKEFKQTAVGNNIKETDVKMFEKALCDAIDICKKIETAKKVKFDVEQIQKIGTTLFLRRARY